ncbi:MAG: amylo-alpha-1,6-glucosidase [Myxococcaceae bacterium]
MRTLDARSGRGGRRGRPLPAWVLGAVAVLFACRPPASEPSLELGPSLEASFQDPLLLPFAAARSRSQYLPDQGYTHARSPEGVLSLVTGTAGELTLAFEVDGRTLLIGEDFAGPSRIDHTASDGAVLWLPLTGEVSAELRLVVASSQAVVLDFVLRSSRGEHRVAVMPTLRRCSGPFTQVALSGKGLSLRHQVSVDPLEQVVGPGTFEESFIGSLVGSAPGLQAAGAGECAATVRDDLEGLRFGEPPPARAAVAGVRAEMTVPAAGSATVRFVRTVLASRSGASLGAVGEGALAFDVPVALREGQARLAGLPAVPGLSREDALAYRSSFVLLDQLMMPAEGKLPHDYFLFSREPTWWFARLGEHLHEGFALISLAAFDGAAAMGALENFFERVEPDGYLPYNIGPVVEQTTARTASAPLLAFLSWEVARQTNDRAFLEAAYAAAVKTHRFWVDQRDQDHDGLGEWGGYAITESIRDLENVIWAKVAPPEQLEALDLNCELVMEEKSLAAMADALGRSAEAQAWRDAAQERAGRINAVMWDEATGFYYHVTRDQERFDYAAPGDLKRMELAGFFPLWAGIVPAARKAVLLEKLKDPQLFWRASGVSGLSAKDPFYSSGATRCCRWNGPVWVQWQLMLARALAAEGENAAAHDLTLRTFGAVRTQLERVHQFRELYDADDPGAPNHSMPNYIWSALAAQMKLEDSRR